MPRLGSLLVCEKIIQDQGGKPSLISVFQKVNSVVPEGQTVPKDALAAMQWSVFSEWFFTQEELTKQWEQVIEVMLPDGSPSPIKGRLALTSRAPLGQGARSFINMMGIPIFQAGPLTVNTWLEHNYERMTDTYSYVIVIEHVSHAPDPNVAGSPVLTQINPNA
jgi:hypothetical protein